MVIDKIFIDTNILIYANLSLSLFHELAQNKIKQYVTAGSTLYLSRQVLREYLSSMTRKNELTAEVSITQLKQDIQFFSEDYYILEDSSSITEKLTELMEEFSVSGALVHDANIVATMIVNKIEHILTYNVSDFKKFEKYIKVISLE